MVRAESITATLVYTYNADGLRVARSQSVESVESVDTFTWDWATPVPELLSDGGSLYLIGYDTLGWQRGADWTFVLPDALGSVRQETDATGAVTAAREWSPYGVEIGGAQAGLGFTGEWWDDAVGLQYLRARWYDGATGRFTQVDLLDLNRPYMYALNNPINWRDPTGYFADETIKNSLKPQTEIDLNSPDLFVTPEWGALENPLRYNLRPKFSGLLVLLKEAKSGDRIRSGRLVQRGWNLEIDWTISRPLKLSRCEEIKVGWLSLDRYIENLRNTSYWLGGYVYHELSSDGEVTIYRDGASLVPDVLMRDISIPGVEIDGLKIGAVWRTSVDRYGNEYESKIIPASGGGSIGISLLPSVGWYAVYLGAEYLSYPDFAEYAVNRGIPERDVIIGKWEGSGKPSFTFGSTITAVAGDLGVGIGGLGSDMTFTMFMKNYLKWSIGLSGLTTSYTTLKGNTYPGWNTLDADTIGVTWADALSTPGK